MGLRPIASYITHSATRQNRWGTNHRYCNGISEPSLLEEAMIEKSNNAELKRRNRANLYTMMRFCENDIDCRRTLTLRYFGEDFDSNACGGSLYHLA